jgi:thioredoxin 1
MSTLTLSSSSFDETISSGSVLVDFWAGWCMPCRMVAPVIEELAEKYKGSVTVAKVNIDEESGLAARYNVMSIPTVILFKDGVEAKRFVGVQTKEKYEHALTV